MWSKTENKTCVGLLGHLCTTSGTTYKIAKNCLQTDRQGQFRRRRESELGEESSSLAPDHPLGG